MELTPDSLDSTRVVVTLRSRDSWTISADAALHGEGRTMIGLSDANIFGSGNRLSVATNFSRNDFGYGGNVVSTSPTSWGRSTRPTFRRAAISTTASCASA